MTQNNANNRVVNELLKPLKKRSGAMIGWGIFCIVLGTIGLFAIQIRPFVRLAVLISEFPIIRKKIHLMLFLKKEIRHRSAKISRQSKLTFSLRKKNLSTTKQSEPGRR